jgi:hypothetical protein
LLVVRCDQRAILRRHGAARPLPRRQAPAPTAAAPGARRGAHSAAVQRLLLGIAPGRHLPLPRRRRRWRGGCRR